MFTALHRILPWVFPAPAPVTPAPIPSLEDAVNDAQAPRRLESIVQHGTKMPAADFITLAMPMLAFKILATLNEQKVAVSYCSISDFQSPEGAEGGTEPSHQRHVVTMSGNEITISHQRQSICVMQPHPEDETYFYPQARFMELSRLTGVIEGKHAHVALRKLAHPYGELAVAPAEPQHLLYYRDLRDAARDNACEPVDMQPPALPPLAEREAQRARVQAMMAQIKPAA